jgi:hypothetical protein
VKAIISGIVIELILLWLLFTIPWGSCEPAGLSWMLHLLHYPVMFLDRLPIWIGLPAAFVICSTIWSIVIYALIRILGAIRN